MPGQSSKPHRRDPPPWSPDPVVPAPQAPGIPARSAPSAERRGVRSVPARAPPAPGHPEAGRDPAPARWPMLFLSQIIGRPCAIPSDEPIGTVADLIVAIGDQYPPVTGLVVATGRRKIFLPWRSVERLDASGARLRVQHDRHRQVPASARTRSSSRATCSTSRSSTSRAARSSGSTTSAWTRWRAPARRRRRRRGGRAAAPPGLEGPWRHARPQPEAARPGALHRLGGRGPAREHHRRRPAPRAPRQAGPAPPVGPRRHPGGPRPARPGRRPRRPRRRGRRRRDGGDGARDPGGRPRGPRPRAGGRHPRGDEPRRRGRPRRRPRPGHPRRDPLAHGGTTRSRRSRSCWATRRTRPAGS